MSTKLPIIIVAHRGGQRGVLKENTLEAFQAAVEQEIPCIEMDIRLNHWNKTFYLEHDLIHKPSVRKNFFDKVVTILPPETTIFCELKTYTLVRTYYARTFLDTIKKYGLEKRVVVMSYNPFILGQLRKIGYEGKLGYLIGSRWFFNMTKWYLKNKIHPDMLMFSKLMISRRLVKFAKGIGAQVFVYVANSKITWSKAIHLGVDGVITDYPLKLKAYLNNKHHYGKKMAKYQI